MDTPGVETSDASWNNLYRVGAATALIAIVVAFLEMLITFLPGGARTAASATAVEWFTLYQNNAFMGLRNLGLMNLIGIAFMAPTFFALYAAHRRVNPASAAFAAILYFIGIAVYIAGNVAFPMLALSQQYAAVTTEAQRAMLAAAGETLLAVGQSHTPGTFMGFFLTEVAGVLIAWVMLRSHIFSRATAYVGLLAWALLLLFDICSAFVPAAFAVAMIFAMGGGLLMIAWYILLARRFFQLGRAVNPVG